MSDDEMIDELLDYFGGNNMRRGIAWAAIIAAFKFTTEVSKEEKYRILQQMRQKELLNVDSLNMVSITEKGLKVYELGGWIAFDKYEKDYRTLSLDQLKSTVTTNDLLVKFTERQLWILWITVAIGIINILIMWFTYREQWRSNNIQEKANLIQKDMLKRQEQPVEVVLPDTFLIRAISPKRGGKGIPPASTPY